MHVDTAILYTLTKQIKSLQRGKLETVLNTYLIANENKQPKAELEQVNNIQPVIFSAIKPSRVAQDEKPNEINQKPGSFKPK